MSTFNLGLPTDIPWKRICVTQDMLDANPCDATRPHPWRHSIAVFRYDPSDDYQADALAAGYKISYLKVSVSITPWAPQLTTNTKNTLVPLGNVDDLEPTYPVYGGLLQVTVAPPPSLQGSTALIDYPYFGDFEPKKREMYEAVTSSGEVLSGSGTALSVGKSAQNTQSLQNYDVLNGWNFNVSGGISLGPVGANASVGGGVNGQWGDVNSNSVQHSDVSTSDSSTERRETESHVTNITQMYNLFQAFHLGTNRAVFLMEPRPHVVQSDATFINGPRKLEGIQEVFLVVIRPNSIDFCVSALLETAHLSTIASVPTKTITRIGRIAPGTLDAFPIPIPSGWSLASYRADKGVEVVLRGVTPTTVSLGQTVNGFTYGIYPQGAGDPLAGSDVVIVTNIAGTSSVDYEFRFHLVADPVRIEETKHMFLVARDVCCCTGAPAPIEHWISYEHDLEGTPGQLGIVNGPATIEALQQSRQMADFLHNEILKSAATSDRRYNRGEITYDGSDAFLTKLASHLEAKGMSLDRLTKPVQTASALSAEGRDVLSTVYGTAPLSDVLKSDALRLAQETGTLRSKILQYKAAALAALRPAAPTSPLPQPLRGIIGVRVASTKPNPDQPKTLAEMSNPNSPLLVDVTMAPDIIEVDFNGQPDAGTVTSSTFTVTRNGVAVSGQVTMPTTTRARFTFFEPVQPGGLYTVTLRGDAPAITFQGRRLDGEAKGLPSGDGNEGGNFEFIVRGSVPSFTYSPNIVVTRLKVVGIRVRSLAPDPTNPRIVAEVTNPTVPLLVAGTEQPSIIDIDFNAHPDNGTVNDLTFVVQKSGTPITGTVTMITATTARFTASTPFGIGNTYFISLRGGTEPTIKYQGTLIDGEPVALPSGNGSPGGDFNFNITIT